MWKYVRKAFKVKVDGTFHAFDTFECAIQRLAPVCSNCGCRFIGHGVEAEGRYYCGADCATHHGVQGVQDRAG